MSTLSSEYKIITHRERVADYLAGKEIMPVSIEMDLTSRCNKSCHNCPSSNSECHWNLDLADIENFFKEMSGHAKGLLLSGGEPTISPVFAKTLELARATDWCGVRSGRKYNKFERNTHAITCDT